MCHQYTVLYYTLRSGNGNICYQYTLRYYMCHPCTVLYYTLRGVTTHTANGQQRGRNGNTYCQDMGGWDTENSCVRPSCTQPKKCYQDGRLQLLCLPSSCPKKNSKNKMLSRKRRVLLCSQLPHTHTHNHNHAHAHGSKWCVCVCV